MSEVGFGDLGRAARPMSEGGEAQALSRFGVIDVGSNSVRLVIFDGAARSPAYFYNEKVMCGLGRDMGETGKLHPEGRERARAAIRRFVILAEGMGIRTLNTVATAAVRAASDSAEFRADVLRDTGLDIHVVDGAEEARLSAQGVLLGWPKARGLVCDIGGSSLELAAVGDATVGPRMSTPLGPLRLAKKSGERKRQIAKWMEALSQEIEPHDRLYLVGGSWRAVARLDMVRRGYPLAVLHDYRMSPRAVRHTLDWIKGQDLEELRQRADLSSARISLVPLAGEVLRRLVLQFKVKEIITSSYGIREGMLYEQMTPKLRACDPLLEACRDSEARNARLPGFGDTLYSFIAPVFARARAPQALIKAACLLHDVSWRAHPDYRAEVCFDNATRGNLGGIDHGGRIFLGLALLHRYRNARPGNRIEPLLDLLDPVLQREAEILGRAMRFGAMFSVCAPDRLGSLNFRPKRRELELVLPPDSADLYGEVAAARFNSLAQALDAEKLVNFTADKG
ncbi:MAG: Ppx/GppA family phosphatase [Pseudomonadota bacterium]